MPLNLGPHEAEVWYAWTAACTAPALQAAYDAWLTPDERAACARFATTALRDEYRLTRALCRTTLSRYADVAPADWRFQRNDYGRPEIAAPAGARPLRFNLSHGRGLVACVVTCTADAGVDVERTAAPAPLDLVAAYFSADERRALQALPAAQQDARFYWLWTLKEAYLKALGLGLQRPLDSFSILDGPEITVASVADPPAAVEKWQFFSTLVGDGHRLSLALRREQAGNFAIRLREVVPGMG
jgi:4'-phosphopantetheinyl transferase